MRKDNELLQFVNKQSFFEKLGVYTIIISWSSTMVLFYLFCPDFLLNNVV
jgi:hypothetical protein